MDPDRVGIWGGWYGGYLAAIALARNSDVFAAGADLDGPPDLILREVRNITVVVDDDENVSTTPLEWSSPGLLVHGDDDGGMRFRASEELDRELPEQRAPIETVVMPGDPSPLLLFKSWKRRAPASPNSSSAGLAQPPRPLGPSGNECTI